jgi:hypothetical protein
VQTERVGFAVIFSFSASYELARNDAETVGAVYPVGERTAQVRGDSRAFSEKLHVFCRIRKFINILTKGTGHYLNCSAVR